MWTEGLLSAQCRQTQREKLRRSCDQPATVLSRLCILDLLQLAFLEAACA